jgi:hypothetical protein
VEVSLQFINMFQERARNMMTDVVLVVQLMRVYGALMWSLGKVINTPEVMRVYIGSVCLTLFPSN